MNQLHDRIIEISKKHNLSHLGSNLTAANIIEEIYNTKKEDEVFVLSAGHSGLALYTVLEKHYGYDAEKLYLKHGTHPNTDLEHKIFCSTGSLGHGIGISVGAALADRSKNVYCLISDGEAFEGTIWEVSNVIDKYKVTNLKIYINYNGYGAYDPIKPNFMVKVQSILPDINVRVTNFEDYGLKGQSAHYQKMV